MTGWEQNHHPDALAGADVDEAASRLVSILDEEGADVVGYDWHGGYGHPDHIRVHHPRAPTSVRCWPSRRRHSRRCSEPSTT
jgi:LmbE family N-acetylglucosaminyl deacetylase